MLALLVGMSACSSSTSTPLPTPTPSSSPAPVARALRDDLQSYLRQRSPIEKISAVSLDASLPDGSTLDATAGTTFGNNSVPVTPKNLYQIASNTKAFTAILCLELQTMGKLSLNQTLGTWLPQYPQWKDVTIRQLLDMTSGIATFDEVPAWEKAVVANPQYNFTPEQLIAYVANEPVKPGYRYSNTNYILAQLVIEKASGQSYEDLVRGLIARAQLHDAYYYPGVYPSSLLARTVAGYFNNADATGFAPILGQNVRDFSLSWGQAAGGIVATPHDVGLWDRAMYQGSILTGDERTELETMVSTKTGEPIDRTTPANPGGFGLGVAQQYTEQYGRIWFYEGETLGYRLLHVYIPAKNVIIVIGLNSVPEAKEDHIFNLFATVLKTLENYGLVSS
jgi:D-alanyl-D-alanine carboxypeptidase